MTDNLSIWSTLGRTNPEHTKGFTRGGGFKGTAIKPIYTEQKMTDLFGPVGIGWGVSKPTFQLVPGENKEVMVFCWIDLWVVHDGKRSDPIPGVGGDKVISYIKPNTQYNRPERWENDDEAFKKAFTDAIGNAMKHLGMSADVHMGLFEDSKYMSELREEAAEEKRAAAKKPEKVVELRPKKNDPLLTEGGDAASRGMDILKVFWTRLSVSEKKLVGGEEQLNRWKATARQADAAAESTPFDDADLGDIRYAQV